MENNLKKQIFIEPGFSKEITLDSNELDNFKIAIRQQWLDNISRYFPEIIKVINSQNLSVKDYHKISNNLDHSNIWTKKSRILPREFFLEFLKSRLFLKLKNIFGEIEISDEENYGYGNIYWRLVRPNQSNDVGPYHRDRWFWELNNNFPKPSYPFYRVKIWISIETERNKSGLLIEKNSHNRKNVNWIGKHKHGIIKPVLLDHPDLFDMELIDTKSGDIIIFNDNLIHGGALNTGENTRVSAEFTILVKDK